MIIDDDPFVRAVTADVLGASGAFVKAFASGREAVDAALAFRPDLVLLDLRMQELDGRATWRILQAKLPQARVIFLTAEDQAHAREEIMDLGAAGIITKPFDPDTLADKIRQLLGGARGHRTALRLDAIAAEFQQSLGPTVATIEGAWSDLQASGWQKDLAEAILSKAHMLAGSAGLFKLHAVGDAADKLEGTLRELLKSDQQPNSSGLTRLENAIGGLTSACRAET